MAFREKRRLVGIGRSRGVVLPKAWLDFYGERVKNLVILGNDILVIAPEAYEQDARRLIALFHKGK